MALIVSPLYIGLMAIIGVILGFRVSMMRNAENVALGHGDSPALERRVRVFGNFMEYAPLAAAVLIALESMAFSGWLLHALGAVFVVSRLAHAVGLYGSSGRSAGRFMGTLFTWLMLFVGGVLCLLGAAGIVL